MARYVVKKNDEDLFIKDWGSFPTYLHFFVVKEDRENPYTENIDEAKIYRSIGGAKNSLSEYINMSDHAIKELKLGV